LSTNHFTSNVRKEFEERAKYDLMLDENTVELAHTSFRSLIALLGNLKLSQFAQEEVMKWKRSMDREGKKKTTTSIYFRSLRAVFNRAVRWKIVQSNPFLDVDIPAPRRGESPPKTMKIDEVLKLLETIEQDGNKKFATCVRFLLYTGCRRNEIVFLRWEDVNVEKGILTVNADKTNKILRLPINKALMRVISGMEIGTGFIFRTDSNSRNRKKHGKPWHESTVSHWFRAYLQKAGLPLHYSVHSLRHTYSNYLREKGVPIDIIQKLLGHSTPRTTWDHYDSSDALTYRQQADLVDFEGEKES